MDKVIKTVIPEQYFDANTIVHVNPCGLFIIGGPMVSKHWNFQSEQISLRLNCDLMIFCLFLSNENEKQGDAGLTGRKIIVDTYGGWGAHGGGAFSGKDFTKVDRSAAYAARWVAKSLVKAKICRRCLVQVSYAIGVAEPISITVFDYGTSKRSQSDLLAIVKRNFDLRPGRIVK